MKKLKPIVDNEDYKKHSGRSSYFLLAIVGKKLQWSDSTLGHVYLSASWQESDAEQKEDWQLSEKHLRAYLPKAKEHDESWCRAKLIIGDLLRRQGKFDDAKKYFDDLVKETEFKGNDRAKIIAFQRRLITAKDSREHGQYGVQSRW